nr:Os03g0706650 [Ipomoea batatas]
MKKDLVEDLLPARSDPVLYFLWFVLEIDLFKFYWKSLALASCLDSFVAGVIDPTSYSSLLETKPADLMFLVLMRSLMAFLDLENSHSMVLLALSNPSVSWRSKNFRAICKESLIRRSLTPRAVHILLCRSFLPGFLFREGPPPPFLALWSPAAGGGGWEKTWLNGESSWRRKGGGW